MEDTTRDFVDRVAGIGWTLGEKDVGVDAERWSDVGVEDC